MIVTSPFSHIVSLPAVSMKANDIWGGLGVSVPVDTGGVKAFYPICALS